MKETLKLALEALKLGDTIFYPQTRIAIAAIEKALAQPAQQEPVAWMDIDEKGSASGLRYWSEPDNRHEVALYTTPPAQPAQERNFCPRCGKRTADLTVIHTCTPPQEQPAQRTWVGLTPEDTFEIGERLGLSDIAWVDLMQAIETKLKEKNT
jgi:hypothetical protein